MSATRSGQRGFALVGAVFARAWGVEHLSIAGRARKARTVSAGATPKPKPSAR